MPIWAHIAVPVQLDSHKRAQVSLGEGMLPQGKQQPPTTLYVKQDCRPARVPLCHVMSWSVLLVDKQTRPEVLGQAGLSTCQRFPAPVWCYNLAVA